MLPTANAAGRKLGGAIHVRCANHGARTPSEPTTDGLSSRFWKQFSQGVS